MKEFIKSKRGIIVVTAVVLVIVSIITASVVSINSKKENTEVTQEEIKEYRNLISDSMDIKMSVFILFETREEAENFIKNHGSDEHPENCGMGAVAYMPDGYYNLVGKTILEDTFDTMSDGEYSKEVIEYDGMFCYLKRLGIKKLSDEEIKDMIVGERQAEADRRKENAK